jgi:heavy metal translocating P-type ATPase
MVNLLSRYFFLAVALASVLTGVAFTISGNEIFADVSWSVGAVIGLVLSIRWLVETFRERALGSDILAVFAIIATALTSQWLAASLISLMLASGRALEKWAQGQAGRHLDALMKRAPQVAHLVTATDELEDVGIDSVPLGSRILVKAGEVVPLDGTLESEGLFDESALTGESLPSWRQSNSQVQSGVVNMGSGVILLTNATAQTSTYANLIRLVASAKQQASKGVRLANVWATRFVPIALTLALLTWSISKDANQAVAVLVAATPCPLILAVPVALVAGISRAAQVGVIIKEGSAIERLAQAEVVLLDKTGTLTEGGPRITNMVFKESITVDEALQLAGSLEQHSANVVARAIVQEAKSRSFKLELAEQVAEIPGHGLSGLVQGKAVRVGQPSLPLPAWVTLSNGLLIEISIEGVPIGFLGLDDPIRNDSLATVKHLHKLGVQKVVVVSGDREETVRSISNELGISEFYSSCTPTKKLEILRKAMEQATGAVIVVGDGINDAPALAAADVGVAMGAKGTTAAAQAASVVIVEDSIRRLANAIDISKTARARALQASAIGMSLAVVAMFIASFGFMDANASALVQEIIDAASITWALVPRKSRL